MSMYLFVYVYDFQISTEVRRLLDEELSSVLLSSEMPTRQDTRRVSELSLSRQLPATPQSHARNLLISSVLNLYFCVQKFADFRKELIVG